MSTTPLWVPLVVAGIGVLGTLAGGIAGGLLTQRWADRRDDKTWARERVREQERWRREDEARTFEHRREVFEDFYQTVKALARKAYCHRYGFTDGPELPDDWHEDAAAKPGSTEGIEGWQPFSQVSPPLSRPRTVAS